MLLGKECQLEKDPLLMQIFAALEAEQANSTIMDKQETKRKSSKEYWRRFIRLEKKRQKKLKQDNLKSRSIPKVEVFIIDSNRELLT